MELQVGNFTDSCIPHFAVFIGCPERKSPTQIHFIVLLAQNFLAGVMLLFTLIRRIIVFKPVQWSNFYSILTTLAVGNFCTPATSNSALNIFSAPLALNRNFRSLNCSLHFLMIIFPSHVCLYVHGHWRRSL